MTITTVGIVTNMGGSRRHAGEVATPSGPEGPRPDAPIWVCILISLMAAVLFTEGLWLIVKGLR